MSLLNRVLLFICLTGFMSCMTLNYPSEEILETRLSIRSQLTHIDDPWVEDKELLSDIFYYVNDNVDEYSCYPLVIDSIDAENCVYLMKPKTKVKAYVLLIHGYMGNLRGLRYIISDLLNNGYGIVALNLPGHSISGGERGDIGDFTHYGVLVNDVVERFKQYDVDISYAVTHSTGCTSLVIYNELYGWPFKRVVFIAPLIRSYMWYPSRIGRTLSKPFITDINARWQGVYAVQTFPMHWFDELVEWNESLKDYSIKSDDLLILQGEQDTVVNWRYNVDFLDELYENAQIVTYPDASHTLFLDVKEGGAGLDLNRRVLDYLSM